jgi:hypothetical protein
VDVLVKKDQHLENQKCYRDPSNIFDFPKVHLFSSRGFFTFLADLAYCAPHAAVVESNKRKRRSMFSDFLAATTIP